jgi:hypothetical protein
MKALKAWKHYSISSDFIGIFRPTGTGPTMVIVKVVVIDVVITLRVSVDSCIYLFILFS